MAISSSSSSSSSENKIALESLEARILGHEKNELAWGERYEFQNYDLKCREIKINNLNLELEKVVKERDELKLKIEKWEGSSKNLTKILNSQMSAHDKNGLGFGTQMDDLSNKSETVSENSLTIFEVRSSDDESTLANNRFTKSNEYHVVPPLITGNPLTPRADISFAGLDEYAFRNKIIESKTTETNKTVGTTNEATILKPKSVNETVVSKSKVNRDEVIIEDWTSDDEDDVCADKTVSSVNVTQAVRSQADKSGQTSQKQGIGFKKVHKIKACFVCKSTGHLIKDCDFYDQKSPEPRVKNVVNTGKRVVKPVWDYGKRVNHQNFSKNLTYPHPKRTFNPSAVLTRAGLVNTDRSNVSTARPLASKIAQTNSVIRPNHPRLDIVRPKASNSPIKRSYFTQPVYRPKGLKPDVKTFGIKNMTTVGTRAVVSKGKVENVLKKDKWVWRPKMNYQDHVYKYNGSYMLKKFEPIRDLVTKIISVVDSGLLISPKSGGWDQFGSTIATALIWDIVALLMPAMMEGVMVKVKAPANHWGTHHTPVDLISSTSQPPIPSPIPLPSHPSPPLQSPPYSPPHSPHQSPSFYHLGPMKHLSLKFGERIEGHQTDTRESCAQIGKEGKNSGKSFEEEIQEISLVRESMKEKSTDFVTPTKASGEAHEEEISPTILEAAKTLSKVASHGVSKEKSTDKGKRYRRRARSMAKKIDTRLDAEEEINTGQRFPCGREEIITRSTHKIKNTNETRADVIQARSKRRVVKRCVGTRFPLNKIAKRIGRYGELKERITLQSFKGKIERYGVGFKTKTSRNIRSDDKDVQIIGEKVVECGKLEDISARSKKWFKDYKSNRADTFYMSLVLMIKTSQREDLIELYRLVMQKYGINKPKDAI
ncbi:ribonuclease H-like domain-containing protein [Tanacetum coccineum]